ncbi:hypothetical protein SDC9_162927 [bioreactor metagenome]|uniref:Uncharacterized protein n=1 Tax=bioreactor metagenome TaxID=1076179 RepID=A0A645FU20_9ZZZZ
MKLFCIGKQPLCISNFFVESCFLMRIFTVTHFLHLFEGKGNSIWKTCDSCFFHHVTCNKGVIVSCMHKYLCAKIKLSFCSYFTVNFKLIQNFAVIRRVNNYCHVLIIFCRRSNHCRPTNINIFNSVLSLNIFFKNGLLKRIKVYNYHVYGVNFKLFKLFHMLCISSYCKYTCMN